MKNHRFIFLSKHFGERGRILKVEKTKDKHEASARPCPHSEDGFLDSDGGFHLDNIQYHLSVHQLNLKVPKWQS